jgi:hypothetical protein
MPSKAKKLLITTVSHEVFIVGVNEETAISGFCPSCDSEVEMLTLSSAARVAGLTGRHMINQIAANEVHSIETANGHLLVCRKSLKLRRSSK